MQYNQNPNKYNIQIMNNNNVQESVIEKAKKFVVNNKGKLAALAGLAALGGGAYYWYQHNQHDNTSELPKDTKIITPSISDSKLKNDIETVKSILNMPRVIPGTGVHIAQQDNTQQDNA